VQRDLSIPATDKSQQVLR